MGKMLNYGDKNFLDGGILQQKDLNSNTGFYILRCDPIPDTEGMYRLGRLYVDLSESWLDLDDHASFYGRSADELTPEDLAIAATDYYAWENFSSGLAWLEPRQMTEKEVIEEMSMYTKDLPDDFEMYSVD